MKWTSHNPEKDTIPHVWDLLVLSDVDLQEKLDVRRIMNIDRGPHGVIHYVRPWKTVSRSGTN